MNASDLTPLTDDEISRLVRSSAVDHTAQVRFSSVPPRTLLCLLVELKASRRLLSRFNAMTAEEWQALQYVRVFMETLHVERSLPADLLAAASAGMNALDKLLGPKEKP